MMTKVTQTQLNYKITNIDGDGATSSLLHGFRDLSALNRKHIEMTTRKGVPLIARFAVSAYGGIIDQSNSGGSTADSALTETDDGTTLGASKNDNVVVIKFFGTLNNWVYRNAAVKVHAARELMFKDAMVKKNQRGAYDHTIHYVWASHSESYMSPLHGTAVETANTIDGGTWEYSRLIYPPNTTGSAIALTGAHTTEESESTPNYLSLTQLYLQSRHAEVPADSNVESATNAAKFSILNKILSRGGTKGLIDEVVTLARDNQDNPPYSLQEVGGDWSTAVEIGRLQFNANLGHAASTVIDAPFGFVNIRAQILNAREHSTGNVSAEVDLAFRLLSIREMES